MFFSVTVLFIYKFHMW